MTTTIFQFIDQLILLRQILHEFFFFINVIIKVVRFAVSFNKISHLFGNIGVDLRFPVKVFLVSMVHDVGRHHVLLPDERVLGGKELDNLAQILAHFAPVRGSVDLFGEDLFEDILSVAVDRSEGQPACAQLLEGDSQREIVCLVAVFFAVQHFGGHLQRRA